MCHSCLSLAVEIGTVGLAITLTLNLMGFAQWGVRQSAETENYMTGVERAFEYCKIEPEAPLETSKGLFSYQFYFLLNRPFCGFIQLTDVHTSSDKMPPKDWPLGGITFRNVSLSYDESEKVDVLKDLTFEIKPREKIGIVGRTGAGKSSILAALYRLTECRGSIWIDGIPIKQLGLHDLRKNISIIPQDPVLFSGTMRYNLDPFDQFKDDELWQVIKEVR
jgi:ATP-binding cassette subfamily C (CFTR/MRP) protein 4